MANLTNAQIESICQTLSPERLAPYLKATETEAEALELYKINITLCQLMYPSLNILEITLRNAIDQVLAQHYGKNWLTNGQFPLEDYEIEMIQKSLRNLRKFQKGNQQPSQSQLIADLSLGFWENFFHKCYDEVFWRPYNKALLPHVTRKADRDVRTIRARLKEIRILRNRISHHEPIWKQHEDLFNIWDSIYRIVGWINPEVVTWMKQIDKFKKIYNEELGDRLEEIIRHQG